MVEALVLTALRRSSLLLRHPAARTTLSTTQIKAVTLPVILLLPLSLIVTPGCHVFICFFAIGLQALSGFSSPS